MGRYLLKIEVELPEDFNESEVDESIAEAICDLGGEVIDSKEFEKLED